MPISARPWTTRREERTHPSTHSARILSVDGASPAVSGRGWFRQSTPQSAAGTDTELRNYLAQMPFHGPRTQKQLGADLWVRLSFQSKTGDQILLRREVITRILAPPADGRSR